MTDHLPECYGTAGLIAPVPKGCICDRLRACEQRVSEETEHAMMEFFYWKPSPPHDRHYFADNICAYCVGREVALIAAREALDALPTEQTVKEGVSEFWVEINHALAAIDALRLKP